LDEERWRPSTKIYLDLITFQRQDHYVTAGFRGKTKEEMNIFVHSIFNLRVCHSSSSFFYFWDRFLAQNTSLPGGMRSHDYSSPACAAPVGWYGEETDPNSPIRTGWHFLQGPLTDRSNLAVVINGGTSEGEERLDLRAASVAGFRTMLRGSEPVLVEDDSTVIRGVAVKVETSTQARRLVGHHAEAYMAKPCAIRFENEKDASGSVDGVTFVWTGPLDDLRDVRSNSPRKL
jgi:hypothetical protein